MTRIPAVLLSLVLVVGLAAVAVAEVAGTWKMTLTADWTSIPELFCTFSQKGNVLSGGCREAAAKSDANVVDVVDGRIDAEMVSWQMKGATPDGEPFTYSLSGTVDAKDTVMRGSFKVSNRFFTGQGSFTATRQ